MTRSIGIVSTGMLVGALDEIVNLAGIPGFGPINDFANHFSDSVNTGNKYLDAAVLVALATEGRKLLNQAKANPGIKLGGGKRGTRITLF